jgi:hypothetical protein
VWGRNSEAATLDDVVELLAGIGTALMGIGVTLKEIPIFSERRTMGTPERRRRNRELQAEAAAYREQAKATFERVEARLRERRERRERGLLRRIFSR